MGCPQGAGEDSEQKIKNAGIVGLSKHGKPVLYAAEPVRDNLAQKRPRMARFWPTISYADEIILHRKNKVICAACQPILVGTPDNTRRTIS